MLEDIYLSKKLDPLSVLEKNLINKKINITKMYNLPRDVFYCKKCVISNQRPRIKFNDAGICYPCLYWDKKNKEIDWDFRKKKFLKILEKYRSKDGSFDCIVPSSGGKDSAYVALMLKNEYGMNPLTVTFAPSILSDTGYVNFQNLVHAGLPNISLFADGITHRKLARTSAIVMGDPFQPFIYGQVNGPLRASLAYKIPLIIDGENGEVEYGGKHDTEELKGFGLDESLKLWFSGFDLKFWKKFGFSDKDLYFYKEPSIQDLKKLKLKRYFFSSFHNWQPQEHFFYCANNANFNVNFEGKTHGTYSKYASIDDHLDHFHFYFALLKFGIGRATSDASHEVREKIIDRDEAISLVRQFDCQKMSNKILNFFMKYCDLSYQDSMKIFKKWTNDNLIKFDNLNISKKFPL